MATSKRGRCTYTQFDKKILCSGTLNKVFYILQRTQGTTEPGVSSGSSPSFDTISTIAGALETTGYTKRFDGVSTVDQSTSEATHVGYVSYDQTVYELDLNKLYIRIPGDRDRLFKMKGIKDYGEESMWLQFSLAETGFDDLEGSYG